MLYGDDAGGGVRGGAIYGASDEHAAYPIDRPCGPEDITATMYWAMGLDHETTMYDTQNRSRFHFSPWQSDTRYFLSRVRMSDRLLLKSGNSTKGLLAEDTGIVEALMFV